MNINPQNQEPRKHALITAEQEALLRAFEQAKKMEFGQFTLHLHSGKISRYEILKSGVNIDSRKSNVEVVQEATEDMEDFETIAI